jgi:phosphoribosylanthranilate isomerase
MSLIKLCGFVNDKWFAALAALDVDLLGFVLAPSKRQVAPETAAHLLERVRQTFPHPPRTVAVVRNMAPGALDEALTVAPFDVVQFHGAESVEECRRVKAKHQVAIIKVFSLDGSASPFTVIEQMKAYVGVADMMLLDTFDAQYGGGSGKTFRWSDIPDIRAWTGRHGLPLLIAGGLDGDNVQSLLHDYAPDGVDVSSGIETNGEKDWLKIITFVERVRAHDHSS